MQLLHNIVLGKRKRLLSSPDELHPMVLLQRHYLIKLEGLSGSPLQRLSFTQNTHFLSGAGYARSSIAMLPGQRYTQNAVFLVNEGIVSGATLLR